MLYKSTMYFSYEKTLLLLVVFLRFALKLLRVLYVCSDMTLYYSYFLAEYAIKKISNLNLPTAPRAACDLVIDESRIPSNGPFMAYLSNLPYEITEDDIAQHFRELKVRPVVLDLRQWKNRTVHDVLKGECDYSVPVGRKCSCGRAR